MKQYNLVYKIVNNLNGMYYIGIHSTDNVQDDYMGSGSFIRVDMDNYGIENFTKEILFNFKTRKEALIKEAELVTKKEIESKKCYNLVLGGDNVIFSKWKAPGKSFDNKYIKGKNKKTEKLSLTILKVMRKGKRIKQSDLAKWIGISQNYLSLIETNRRAASIEIIENICDHLDCELRIIPIKGKEYITK